MTPEPAHRAPQDAGQVGAGLVEEPVEEKYFNSFPKIFQVFQKDFNSFSKIFR